MHDRSQRPLITSEAVEHRLVSLLQEAERWFHAICEMHLATHSAETQQALEALTPKLQALRRKVYQIIQENEQIRAHNADVRSRSSG